MKKKADPHTDYKSYVGLHLYRDDIELILAVFQENECTPTIADSELEFDSLDELIDKRGITPAHFEIAQSPKSGDFSSISFSLNNERISIHASFSSEKSKIVFAKLNEICESHKSTTSKILNPWFYIPPTLYLSYLLFYVIREKAPDWLTITTAIAAVLSFCSIMQRIRPQVNLRRKHEGGFWKRNSEKIWLLIIGALIGFFVKFIFDSIIKNS